MNDLIYTGWGLDPQIQTTDITKDLYYNPQSPAQGKEFAWVPDPRRGTQLQITMDDSIAGDASNGKVMVGPPQSNSADIFLRWWTQLPNPAALPPVTGAFFQFAEYPYGPPYDGPPPVGVQINGDSGVNHWGLYLGPGVPNRWAWVGPPVDASAHEFILHVRSSATSGLVELWFDRTKAASVQTPTIIASNATGPQRLILDAYCSKGLLKTPVAVFHSPPVIGTSLSEVATSWRLHHANAADLDFMDVDSALAAARSVVAGGKAVFLTRE